MKPLVAALGASVTLLTASLPSGADAPDASRLPVKGAVGGHGVTVPILAAVSTTFGKWTAQNRGSVRPSSPYLGLVVSTGGAPITSWDIRPKAGACPNAAQWSSTGDSATGTGLAESSTRRMPAPSGNSNITTNCTWTVRAYNSAGGSNTVDYAVKVDPCAIQIGDRIRDDSYDYGAMGVAFATFLNATRVASGCPARKILIAEGIQRQDTAIGFSNMPFDALVYVQYADPTNPAPLRRVSCSSTAPNMVWRGLRFSSPAKAWGDTGAPRFTLTETPARIYLACPGGKAVNNVIGLHPTDYRLDLNAIEVSADDVEVSGNIIRYASRGLMISDNTDRLYAHDNDIRKWHRNGIFFGRSNITGVLIYRNLVASTDVSEEETGPSVHPDNIQWSDNNTGHSGNRIIQNIFCSLSDTSGTQGLFSGAGQPADYEIAENLFCINLANGIAIGGNGGASKINDNTLIKFETGAYAGVKYRPEPGAGPWISLEGSDPAKWTGTLSVNRNVTQDKIRRSGSARAAALGAGGQANVEFNNRTLKGFTAGNPQMVGQAYFAANNSDNMTMAQIFTYLKTLTRRGDGLGWVDSSGAFKRTLP